MVEPGDGQRKLLLCVDVGVRGRERGGADGLRVGGVEDRAWGDGGRVRGCATMTPPHLSTYDSDICEWYANAPSRASCLRLLSYLRPTDRDGTIDPDYPPEWVRSVCSLRTLLRARALLHS